MDGIEKEIQDKLQQICKALMNRYNASRRVDDIGLMGGATGIMLFMYYYGDHVGDSKATHLAEDLLQGIYSWINSSDDIPISYAEGLTGFLTAVSHLEGMGLVDKENVAFSADVDSFLGHACVEQLGNGDDDFLYGAGGQFFYLLCRYKSTADEAIKNNLRRAIHIISERHSRGMQLCSNGDETNMGLPHGISSWMILLSQARMLGLEAEKCSSLTDNLYNYYKPYIWSDRDCSSGLFPMRTFAARNGSSFRSRLGWCYGDMPCLLALDWYAESASKPELQKRVAEIMEHETMRTDLESNAIHDACLCHGTSTMMFVFKDRYRKTGISVFLQTSDYWARETLGMARWGFSPAGYRRRGWENGHFVYLTEYGLLNGIVGIGLSMLGYLSERHSTWKELLLI